MSAIKIQSLTKKFNNFTAVSGLSFDVAENRVMGFLGPNGAGKTTTIRILVGLSKPTSGSITIASEEIIFGNSSNNKLFGYLPEQPAFYNWMTGKEYLEFVANTFGIKTTEKESTIKKLLKLVDLSEAKDKKISAYSNGMKQRLGIAQALVNEPKVLIMDEPVSALDPIGRREVLAVIENLKKTMTILLSTHILSDVDRICDDVAIINKGKLITVSSLADLKKKYATNILEVEFDSDPESVLPDLKKQEWATKIEKNGNHLKVWLRDDDTVKSNLALKFLAQFGIGVLSYGLSLPEVEDLFIDLIKEAK
jgi:ABC-2 type transport system ATP-binding protein